MNTIKLIIVAVLMMITANAAKAQLNDQTKRFSTIQAHQKDNRLYIDWTADSASSNYFEVQKSEDGKNFKTIALVMGADPRKTADQFGYTEKIKQDNNKATYFRLKHIDANGNEQISEIIKPVK